MPTVKHKANRFSPPNDSDTPVAFDDPVPADSGIFRDLGPVRSHSLERQVLRKLLAQPNLAFSSLVVRRTPVGICLEGVLTATDGSDICSLARQIEGVENVLNHVLVQTVDLADELPVTFD